MPLETEKLKPGWLGAGFSMLNHKAGSGYLDLYKVMLSGSYFKPLNGWFKQLNQWHNVSFGFQGGMLHYTKDYRKLSFEEQFPDNEFNPDDSITNVTKLDLQAGLLYSYTPHEWFKLYTGIALSHFLSPNEKLIEYHLGKAGNENRSGIKPVIHSNAIIYLGSRIELSPSILYMYHKQANLSRQRRDEITLGTSAGFHFEKYYNWSATYYLGTWYGFKDEVVFMVGLRYHKWMFEISTDVKISLLEQARFDAEHPEFTLTYLFHILSEKETQRLPWLMLD